MQSLKLWYALFLRPSRWRLFMLMGLAPITIIAMRLVDTNDNALTVATNIGMIGGALGGTMSSGIRRPYVEYLASLPFERAKARALPYEIAFIFVMLTQVPFFLFEYTGANNFAARGILAYLNGDFSRVSPGYLSAWPPIGALGFSILAFFTLALADEYARFDPRGPSKNGLGEKVIVFVVFLALALCAWFGVHELASELFSLDPHGSTCVSGLVMIPLAVPLARTLHKRVIRCDTDHYPLAVSQ